MLNPAYSHQENELICHKYYFKALTEFFILFFQRDMNTNLQFLPKNVIRQ